MDRLVQCPETGACDAHGGVSKVVATLQATAALVGIAVDPERDGGFRVSRWGLERNCDSLDDLTRLLARMGVNA